ncbi:MAG: DUF4350 domain-containing protein [Halobacteriales archaeon]
MDDATAGRAVAFAGVFLAVVIVGTALSVGGGVGTAPAISDLNVEPFTGDDAVATPPPETGELSMSADASGTVVVVDAAHGNAPDSSLLAPMTNELSEQGATVRYYVGSSAGQRLAPVLREADAFVVFGGSQRFSDDELEALAAFSEAGGRVLVLNEPSGSDAGAGGYDPFGSDVSAPLTPVVSQYGMDFGDGYLFDVHEYSGNYRNVYATPTGSSPLTEGVDRLVFHESVSVRGGDTLVTTRETAAKSTTRRQAAYGVVSRAGDVVVVGDASVLSRQFLYRADNEVFVSNLLDFLVTGDKTPDDAPQPPGPQSP